MVTLPPIGIILYNLGLDNTQHKHLLMKLDTNGRPSRDLHDLPGLAHMLNFPDLDGVPNLPRIRGPDHVQNLPRLRDIHGDQLDKYRRSSQGASERQDPEEVRQALHSPTRVSQEDHNRKRKGDDVGRWVQSK